MRNRGTLLVMIELYLSNCEYFEIYIAAILTFDKKQ